MGYAKSASGQRYQTYNYRYTNSMRVVYRPITTVPFYTNSAANASRFARLGGFTNPLSAAFNAAFIAARAFDYFQHSNDDSQDIIADWANDYALQQELSAKYTIPEDIIKNKVFEITSDPEIVKPVPVPINLFPGMRIRLEGEYGDIQLSAEPVPETEPDLPTVIPEPGPITIPEQEPANDPVFDPDDQPIIRPGVPPFIPEYPDAPSPNPLPGPGPSIPSEPAPDADPDKDPEADPERTPRPEEEPNSNPEDKPDIYIPNPDYDPFHDYEIDPDIGPLPDIGEGYFTIGGGTLDSPGFKFRFRRYPIGRPDIRRRPAEENTMRFDNKYKSAKAYLATLNLITTTFGTVSEVLDFMQALTNNIYFGSRFGQRTYKLKSLRNNRYYEYTVYGRQKLSMMPVNLQVHILSGIATGQIHSNSFRLDTTGLAIDFMTMQIQDRAIGTAARLERSIINNNNMPSSLDFGNFSTWWTRQQRAFNLEE